MADFLSDSDGELIEVYAANYMELAKAIEKLLPKAAKLKDTEEWAAFKRVLKSEIAKECLRLAKNPVGANDEFKKGMIRGMDYVVELAEKHIDVALDKKKAAILASKKNKNLTQETR